MRDHSITSYEAGKKGGSITLKKYGKEHYRNLTKKRFEGMSKEEISEFMKKVSHARFTPKE